jgi:hypothetical protein
MERIESLFQKSKSVLGEKRAKSLWLAYTSETDLNKRREIEGFLYGLLAKRLDETFQKKKIILEPPPETISGPYKIGTVISGDKEISDFELSDRQLNQHIGIWGMTGSGKTNIVHLIVSSLIKSDKSFLIFDWKRNFRDLLEQKQNNLRVYTVGRTISPFHWNPLIPPPGTDPSVWLKQFIEVCQHALFLGHGVERLLQKVFDQLYQKYDVYSGHPEYYPTLEEAQEILDNYRTRGREAQWLDSTKRAVGALCFGGIGEVLNVRTNSELALNQNIVFELDSLTDSEKTFFTEIILLWIYHKRLTEPVRDQLKHVVIVEEAHHVLSYEKQRITGKETITDMILRQIRELGEGIIVIDQQPSLITPTALANTHTHMAMKMFYPDDVYLTTKLLNLNSEDSDYLRMLQTGFGIVKVPEWHKPFLAKFDFYPIQKGLITDQELEKRLYDAVSIEIGYEELRKEFDRVIMEFRSTVNTEQVEESLSPKEWRLLADVAKYPFSGMVERYHRLGLNAYQGNKAKQGLIQKNLAIDESISGPTGQLKLLALTKAGIAKFRENGTDPKSIKSNSSLEHEYWKHVVKNHLQGKGYVVQDEVSLHNGHAVDLVAEIDSKRIAIEIETGKSDSVNNVLKDLEDGFDSVISLALKNSVLNKLRAELDSFGAFKDARLRLIYVGEIMDNKEVGLL